MQNFDAGIGQKFFLLFGVADLIDIADAYIVLEGSQFDSYSYLFNEPYFISLSDNPQIAEVPLVGMRIGLNGREADFGQVFATLDTAISAEAYQAGTGQVLSRQGTIIPLDKGPEQDEFFLTFERLGDHENVRVSAPPPQQSAGGDLTPQSQIGVRDFAEINASMAALTTVPSTNAEVRQTYTTLIEQLPAVTDLGSFVAANQMAITQLAIKYCDQLVEETSLRNAYFPGFDFNRPANIAFDTAGRNQILNPLTNNMLGAQVLTSQPAQAQVTSELHDLIDGLTECSDNNQCDQAYTATVVKASCAALLGSAVVVLQ